MIVDSNQRKKMTNYYRITLCENQELDLWVKTALNSEPLPTGSKSSPLSDFDLKNLTRATHDLGFIMSLSKYWLEN